MSEYYLHDYPYRREEDSDVYFLNEEEDEDLLVDVVEMTNRLNNKTQRKR